MLRLTLSANPEKTISILPVPGGDDDCDEADGNVLAIEQELNEVLDNLKIQMR